MTVREIENLGEFIDFVKKGQDDNTKSEIFEEQILAFLAELPKQKSPVQASIYNGRNSIEYFDALADEKFFYSLLDDFKKEKKASDTSANILFFYRGHYNPDYKLIPSVFRSNNWSQESYFYHEIMVRCPEEFKNFSHLDRLVHMQHYSCPTRLLDVTSNPLVALFFACKNFGCEECDKSGSGKVFMFCIPRESLSYYDSDRVLMLSCLPVFNEDFKEKLLKKICESGSKFKLISSRYSNSNVERFYHEITRETPAFKRRINPVDLLKPIFVQPNGINKRMVAQNGAFILSGLSRTPEQAESRIKSFVCAEIIIKNREKILKELDMIGINEASLFPDLEHIANYLKSKINKIEKKENK